MTEIEDSRIRIAQNFKNFRKSEIGSQEMAAEMLNVQQPFISKMENGSQEIDNRIIRILHIKKDLNINWLFTSEGNMKVNSEERKTLVTDMKYIKANYEVLEKRIKNLEYLITHLQKQPYAT